MLKKIYFSLLWIFIIVISVLIFEISVFLPIMVEHALPHSVLGMLISYLLIFLPPALFLAGFYLLGNFVFKKYIDESSQSSKEFKILMAFSPVWFFPVVFGIGFLVKICINYYF